MSVDLDSDVDLDPKSFTNGPKSNLPMLCFRQGSPPLPDVHNTSSTALSPITNGSFGGVQGTQISEVCYAMQKHITMRFSNEQISAGIWYVGFFNGIGVTRTQSKMINRGPSYSFNGNVTVEGCMIPMMWGKYCNQTIDQLSCVNTDNLTNNTAGNNQTAESMTSCKNDEKSCSRDNELKVYYLDIMETSEKIIISVNNIKLNQTQFSNATTNSSSIVLMCYARHGAMPVETLHDYSGNINNASLAIQAPKVGRWYIAIQPVNISKALGGLQATNIEVCYSLDWQVLQCPFGKAGSSCSSEAYALQTVLRKNPFGPFESYYLPVSNKVLSATANFLLEPLLTNTSYGRSLDDDWTYFLLDIPSAAAGGNMHIRLSSDVRIEYQIYARYGGLSSLDNWDYYYINATSSSSSSMFFKVYESTKVAVSFYILYVRGGTWSIALRNPMPPGSANKSQTTMSISIERCPRRCSSPHGSCQTVMDANGLTLYSYCHCDNDHGGFDCSVEIVSRQGHIWQSISLIASNAAAVLPAYWALRQRAFAEWVLYTSSGISSGLYHACDVGTWCPLSFHVLQFMDFWLSFMAVVSTFVYLATIDEASKRTIQTVVAILTALMAETGPTRSSNIVLVIAIGAAGLLVGWLMELATNYRTLSFSPMFSTNIFHRWQSVKEWTRDVLKKVIKRFRWGFILAGFTALSMAAISWQLETSENYWIWHSMWHISIYTCSFLFLCSKAKLVAVENHRPVALDYELTRQNSFSRE